MRLPNSKLSNTNSKNASILAPHFERVYTTHRPIAWDALDDTHQRDIISQIDGPIEWDEFMQAICKLGNEKSPGLNEVPQDTYKTLSDQNLNILYRFLTAYWHKKITFTEWHEGKLVPIPKSGDLSDLKKCRGVTLMDMVSKIFSRIYAKDCL